MSQGKSQLGVAFPIEDIERAIKDPELLKSHGELLRLLLPTFNPSVPVTQDSLLVTERSLHFFETVRLPQMNESTLGQSRAHHLHQPASATTAESNVPSSEPSETEEEDLDSRERKTWARVVRVLAAEAGLDLTQHTKAAGVLSKMAAEHGLNLPGRLDTTIANKLALARDIDKDD